MTVSAVSPWRTAFRLERRLPDSVRGPVLCLAFCSISKELFSVVINSWPLFWCAPWSLIGSVDQRAQYEFASKDP